MNAPAVPYINKASRAEVIKSLFTSAPRVCYALLKSRTRRMRATPITITPRFEERQPPEPDTSPTRGRDTLP